MAADGAEGHPGMSGIGKLTWSKLALAGLLLAWLAVAAFVQPARADEAIAITPSATLIIHVENVGKGGIVRLGLYDETNYPDDNAKPVASADVQGVAGETVITLRDVPPGIYAIETYQDVNCNGRMDTTWLGLPLEPYGFSRDARPVLSKPPFSKVKFALLAGAQDMTLHLQNGVSFVASK
jgi:uncharacterized protein (DUF2141 family)